jgi:glycosyltransferase involved in cell wall biosynthesis
MSGMRVLYIAPYIPSPIRVRPWNILRHLALMGRRISIVALDDGFASESIRSQLAEFCEEIRIIPHPQASAARRCLSALTSRMPFSVAHDNNPALAEAVRAITREKRFDIVHVEHLRAASIASALGELPRIIDAVDCMTQLRLRIAGGASSLLQKTFSRAEAQKLKSWEPDAYRSYRRIVMTTGMEAAALTELDPTTRLPLIEVINNGVDSDYFRPDFDPDLIRHKRKRVIFSGKMSYVANYEAARYLIDEITPRLRILLPRSRVVITGANPPFWLIQKVNMTSGVEIWGYREDMRPHLKQASVAVCPVFIGAGIQNKALEAMAMTLPIVLSPLASRPLTEALNCGAAFSAENAKEFTERIAWLLTDGITARAVGERARDYVMQHHRWEDSAQLFADLYEKVIG